MRESGVDLSVDCSVCSLHLWPIHYTKLFSVVFMPMTGAGCWLLSTRRLSSILMSPPVCAWLTTLSGESSLSRSSLTDWLTDWLQRQPCRVSCCPSSDDSLVYCFLCSLIFLRLNWNKNTATCVKNHTRSTLFPKHGSDLASDRNDETRYLTPSSDHWAGQ